MINLINQLNQSIAEKKYDYSIELISLININQPSDQKNYPIQIAVKHNAINILELLVLFEANMQVMDQENNNLLHLATLFNNFEAFLFLFKKQKINPLEKNKKGQTVLDIAKMKNNQKIIAYLEKNIVHLTENQVKIENQNNFSFPELNINDFKILKN